MITGPHGPRRFIILDTPRPLSGSGLVVALTTLNSHFEPWNGFMFSLGYMKNLPSCRENLSITIQRTSALTLHFLFRASANKLSYMNSQKQIVIQDSGVIMCQLCIYVVSQIATQQKKLNYTKFITTYIDVIHVHFAERNDSETPKGQSGAMGPFKGVPQARRGRPNGPLQSCQVDKKVFRLK